LTHYLIGGFNPPEKYEFVRLDHHPNFGGKVGKCSKPPTSHAYIYIAYYIYITYGFEPVSSSFGAGSLGHGGELNNVDQIEAVVC
jgi:hypothetical protein